MMTLPMWLGVGGLAAMLAGAFLIGLGSSLRSQRGLGEGKTVALDDRTLYSHRFKIKGRPDRIVRINGELVPEEWKSASRLRDSHIAQMAVYFLLMEEAMGVRPSHGIVVTGDGKRHTVPNSLELKTWVLDVVLKIRHSRKRSETAIRVRPSPAQCRMCGMRGHCSQAMI